MFKLLREPTYLTSAPLVYFASISSNIVLVLAESFLLNRERIAYLLHRAQYIAPFLITLTYCLVEARLGGITTPDIGPDTLTGDIVSGIVGGGMAILTVALADRSIEKRK
jgi:hypothetical protein